MGEPTGSSYFCIIRRYITMMVIQGRITSATEAGAIGVGVNIPHIFPADRCVWTQTAAAGGGYNITTVRFFPGVCTNWSSLK